jgi:hypothetical protein
MKGSEYLCICDISLLIKKNKLAKKPKPVFALSLWGIVFR